MNLKAIKHTRNGEKVHATFSMAEYDERQEKLRRLMGEKGLDAILFTSIHNINYYSDFLYCAFGRPYGLVITHEEVVSISANIDGGQPWRRTQGTDNIVYTDWHQDNFPLAVKEHISSKSTVGVEYDHITKERLDKLAAAFPDFSVKNISADVMRLRMIKSSEEIALIKNGAEVSNSGGRSCIEAISEGVPEYEVALHSTQAMIREIAVRYPHAELMDTWTWFQSGINTDGAHNPVTTRSIQKGDILSLNCFSMIAGYYTALERTLFFHSCDEDSLNLWEINCAVHKRGLELVAPGKRCCDIAQELNEIYAEHNLLDYRTFGYGHSFGVLSHYYGREAGLELREDIETVIRPNMVISMEPMIMLPEGSDGAGGYREHDILVVTETGNENITNFPYGPEHNIIK